VPSYPSNDDRVTGVRKDHASVVCSNHMRAVLLLGVMLASIGAAGPQDELVRARQLYNQQLYNLAIDSANTARHTPQLADAATLVIARSLLERFRKEAAAADLDAARTELQQIRPAGLSPSDQAELIIALGELLYLDDQPGAAAVEFERALDRVESASASHERVLDWWASAVDRQAQMRPEAERAPLYSRIIARMEDELRRNAASAVASYWLVAGARGNGDLERAWDAAFAAWARASFTGDRRLQLRADLDQIVTQAIIPERARLVAPAGGAAQSTAAMRGEWDALKQVWGP
jgi:hypothetical protein